MKRIVMLCNYFAPDNKIAAIRITKLAKYIRKYGYEVTVISEQKFDPVEDELLKRDAEGINSVRISNSECVKRVISAYQKLVAPYRQKRLDNVDNRMRLNKKSGQYEFFPFEVVYPVIGSLDYLMNLLKQYDLFWMARRDLRSLGELTCIFSSYGDYFGILAGKYLHKKQRNTRWIVDLRDGICQYKFTPKYVKWIARLFEHDIWRNADCITAVSKGLCKAVPQRYWKKVHCVTNGFDGEDRVGIQIKNHNHDKLRFAYTGGMYGGVRNLAQLFNSVRMLADEKKIDLNKIEFCYAGKESAYSVFYSQAEAYGLGANCVYCGSLPRKESLKLQMEADILLVATRNSATEEGIITGKALEYMSAGRPVIAVISGDKPDSELRRIISYAKLGFAYEEANREQSERGLRSYLLGKYNEFAENGRLEHDPDRKILRKYDYQYLGYKMVRIIELISSCDDWEKTTWNSGTSNYSTGY